MHQVVGDAVGVFADTAALVGADGIEVAQQHHRPLGVGSAQVGENALNHKLGATIGVGDGAGGHILLEGGGVAGAVDGGRGGENHPLTAHLGHHLTQHHGAVDVVVEVSKGNTYGLAYGLQAGEVNDRVNLILAENTAQTLCVTNIALIEGEIFT